MHKLTTQSIYFGLVGFLSGFPFILFSETLQAWYTAIGQREMLIAVVTYLGMPYVIKPVFAMLIDKLCFQGSSWDYHRCLNLVACSLGLLLCVSNTLDPSVSLVWHLAVMAIGVMLSAIFDTLADGIRIQEVNLEAQAWVTSVYVAAYRLALILGGAGAMLWAEKVGWSVIYSWFGLLYLTVWLVSMILKKYAGFAKVSAGEHRFLNQSSKLTFAEQFKYLLLWLNSHKVRSLLPYALLLRSHDCFIKPLLIPFLVRGLGFSMAEIGGWYKLAGFTASIVAGASVSYALKFYKQRELVPWIISSQLLCSFLFLLSYISGSYALAILAIVSECCSMGLTGSLSVVMLSASCDRHMASTQYAYATSILSVERMLLVPLSSYFFDAGGWLLFWGASMVLLIGFFFMVSWSVDLDVKNSAWSEALG